MKILICDDSITIRKKLIEMLIELTACEIIEASNGEEAIALYASHKPDLVFMDIIMPVKDGLEAVAEIMNESASARIVMLTSVGTKENLLKALKLGACDFIQKPVDKTRLSLIIDTITEV